MTKDEAQQDLARRKDIPIKGDVYRHHKGGLYVVEAVGLAEDLKTFLLAVGVSPQIVASLPDRVFEKPAVMVSYRSNARKSTWVRPLSDWEEVVEWPDGAKRPRFTHEPH